MVQVIVIGLAVHDPEEKLTDKKIDATVPVDIHPTTGQTAVARVFRKRNVGKVVQLCCDGSILKQRLPGYFLISVFDPEIFQQDICRSA